MRTGSRTKCAVASADDSVIVMIHEVATKPSSVSTNSLPRQNGSSRSSMATDPWPLRALRRHPPVHRQHPEQRQRHDQQRRQRRHRPGGQRRRCRAGSSAWRSSPPRSGTSPSTTGAPRGGSPWPSGREPTPPGDAATTRSTGGAGTRRGRSGAETAAAGRRDRCRLPGGTHPMFSSPIMLRCRSHHAHSGGRARPACRNSASRTRQDRTWTSADAERVGVKVSSRSPPGRAARDTLLAWWTHDGAGDGRDGGRADSRPDPKRRACRAHRGGPARRRRGPSSCCGGRRRWPGGVGRRSCSASTWCGLTAASGGSSSELVELRRLTAGGRYRAAHGAGGGRAGSAAAVRP